MNKPSGISHYDCNFIHTRFGNVGISCLGDNNKITLTIWEKVGEGMHSTRWHNSAMTPAKAIKAANALLTAKEGEGVDLDDKIMHTVYPLYIDSKTVQIGGHYSESITKAEAKKIAGILFFWAGASMMTTVKTKSVEVETIIPLVTR